MYRLLFIIFDKHSDPHLNTFPSFSEHDSSLFFTFAAHLHCTVRFSVCCLCNTVLFAYNNIISSD